MSESRMLGSDPSSRVDAIRWGPRVPRFSASLFIASVAGALIPVGAAFVGGRNLAAPASDLTSGAAGHRIMASRDQVLPGGQSVDVHASAANSSATPAVPVLASPRPGPSHSHENLEAASVD